MPKLTTEIVASQREQAYRSLRRLLILQQVEPGQRLREPQWAERLQVHRSALREAFARLEAEGLVERGPSTGYFVPKMTDDDLKEVTKLRLALECIAIDEICATEVPDVSMMTQATEEFERFLQGDYSLGALEADRRFHEALIDSAKMRRLSALYHRAPLPLIHGTTEDQERWRQACTRTLGEHRQIIESLKNHNAKDAKKILTTHLMRGPTLPVYH